MNRLKHLIEKDRLIKEGEKRGTKYYLAGTRIPLSKQSLKLREYARQPIQKRKPVGYNQEFLFSYRPNITFYLSDDQRKKLHAVGSPEISTQPAGTYAKQILNRLLIDLSWNSSRLEGNTYSFLDTKRLLNWGDEPEGKHLDKQMIINHKQAIEVLVENAEEISFNRHTILNTHAMLADNLLDDPTAPGRLRRGSVSIGRSTFLPLEMPQRIEECFEHILEVARAIDDPFEQSFFVMVQLPYLQAFDDVNKRVSRISGNIPFIKHNLIPLSFIDVPSDLYVSGLICVYELNRVELLREVFIWAYERSAARYAAVRQSLGEPDPFKLRYRDDMRLVIREIVEQSMGRKEATGYISRWTRENIEAGDQEQFSNAVRDEALALHEGNFARYQIRPSQFRVWQDAWSVDPITKLAADSSKTS